VQGQEVLSSDGVNVKISMAAEYEIADPAKAINGTAQYQSTLYLQLQAALRDVTAGMTIDEFMEKRTAVNERLLELSSAKATDLGLRLKSVTVKDVMFSGELKRVFAQVTKARKEGLAALEKARGETAALRNLANAARMMEETPSLLQLRALQMLGESSGNTIVLGVDKPTVPIVKNNGSDGKT
jgi:regulator of protease activity HflC (stomatin/prohibitin superfamily)